MSSRSKKSKKQTTLTDTDSVQQFVQAGVKQDSLDKTISVQSHLARGTKKKVCVKQQLLSDAFPCRKKRDRFNGLSEDQVLAMTLPDHLCMDLDIVIIGINPGLTAAHVGHHYAGPGNHFWKCLYLSGLTSEQMNAYSDYKLKEVGIGFTNIVSRTSRSSSDLSRTEIKEGAQILQEKIQKYRPKIAAFNGKGIYEVFCGHKSFYIGKQPEPFPGTDTVVFVMPSSSARCSQLPRAADKVPFYLALRKLRDHLCGQLPDLDPMEVVFPDLDLKVEPKKERIDDVNVKSEASSATESKVKVHRKKKDTSYNVVNGPSRESLFDGGTSYPTCGLIDSINDPACMLGMGHLSSAAVDSDISVLQHPAQWNGRGVWPWQASLACDAIDSGLKPEQPCDMSQYGCMPGSYNSTHHSFNS